MGENPSPPYRVTRAQEPDSATATTAQGVADATKALAHRLRMAAGTPWDGDKCDVEATAYVTNLLERGWVAPRPLPPAWQPGTVTPANPTTAQRAAAEARAAIRANRPDATGTRPRATLPPEQGEADPKSADNTTGPQNAAQPC